VGGSRLHHPGSLSPPTPALPPKRGEGETQRLAAQQGNAGRSWCVRAIFLLSTVLLSLTASAQAHPVPKAEYDRNISVQLGPTSVEVTYRLEIDQLTLFQTVPKLDEKMDLTTLKGPRDFAQAFLDRMKVVIPDNLVGTLNGQRLNFTARTARYEILDSVQFHYRFRAAFTAHPGKNRFELTEQNFPDKKGLFRISLDVDADVKVPEVTEPIERRTVGEGDDEKKRTVAAVFEGSAAPTTSAPKPAEPEVGAAPAEPDSLIDRLRKQGVSALFDSSSGLMILLLLAFVFGAAHALTPGHGKTLVAAYLVGERGTVGHAFILGLVTTLTHTGTVILIALGLWYFYRDAVPEDVQKTLGFVGGLLIAALGLWLLLRRVAGQADHVHLSGHGHSHSHGGHEHSHGQGHEDSHSHGDLGRGGWVRLVLLGMTGGMIPCWDAVVLLGIAISTHQLWLGVPLLLAFSAGLASVLIAIGVAVVYAQRFGAGRWHERRWFKALPIISAVLVMAIGLWLCADSLR
jgi:nickel/cobalt transporter (NicO) family protein